jgi:hypothetical protein
MKLTLNLVIRSITTLAVAMITAGYAVAASCTHYASPSGGGNGSSSAQLLGSPTSGRWPDQATRFVCLTANTPARLR